MRNISIDFETPYDPKNENPHGLKQQGTWNYVHDPRTVPYLISVSDGADTWAGHPSEFNWEALRDQTWLSHNRYFDSHVYREMVKQNRAPLIPHAAWHCTANLTTYLCMRRDLARAAEFLLGAAADKSYREDAEGKSWDQMVAAGVAEKVKEAGRVDALRCWQFFAKYGHLWPDMERDLSDLSIRQGQRGAQIDRAKLDEFTKVAQTMLIQAETILPWMKEGKKPTSTKAIAEECRRVGIPCPPVKKWDGEEAYDLWASTYGLKHSWVKAYTDYRVVNLFLKKLDLIRERLHVDEFGVSPDVFSYDMLYFGAHTGRWAGAGGFNMQNMRKQALFCDGDGFLVTDVERLKEISNSKKLPDYVAHALDIRALFIARPGRKLIISDLAQIEPRVLAWLVNDTAMLASMAAGQSPYEAHARATMNWTGGDMKKEGKELYALAKARVLGLGYGCGPDKFITVAMNMAGIDITIDDPQFEFVYNKDGEQCFNLDRTPKMQSGRGANSRRIVKEYRESNPLIVGLWKRLDDAFRDSVGGDFTLTLPSGRQLRYPEVKREFKRIMDPDRPGKFKNKVATTALTFDPKRNGVVRTSLYGGLLTENLVQATARDIFGECLLSLDRTPGVDVLWSVHDEAVNEVDMNVTVRDVQECMSKTPSWIPGCPISAETVEAPHYMK